MKTLTTTASIALTTIAMAALHLTTATSNAQKASSGSFELLAASPGVSGGAVQNESRSVVVHSTIGDATGGTVSTVTASGYQQKPGYAGQIYDIVDLTFSAIPDPVLENTVTQLTPGPATLDDNTTLLFEPSEILWSIVSGPIAGIDETGIAIAGPIDDDTVAILEGTVLNFTGQFEVTIGTEVVELVLTSNNAEGGTISGGGFHSKGADVPITATPAGGYRFAGWVGEGIADPGATNTTVNLAVARSVSATFVKVWTLTNTANPETGGFTTGRGVFDDGSSVAITAIPADGHRFGGWVGEGVDDPQAATTAVRMTADRQVSANFIKVWTLILSPNPETGGIVTEGGIHDDGSSVGITASPAEGYRFAGWMGEGVADPDAPSTSVAMTADRGLTAAFFKVWELTVAVNPENSGTVTGAGTYDHGELAPITAIAAEGFQFANWTGEGISNSNATRATVEMSAARAAVAHFTPDELEPIDFRILAIWRMPDGSIALEWSSVVGGTYQVESAFNLNVAEWETRGSVTATSPLTGFTTGARQQREEYFRIRRLDE